MRFTLCPILGMVVMQGALATRQTLAKRLHQIARCRGGAVHQLVYTRLKSVYDLRAGAQIIRFYPLYLRMLGRHLVDVIVDALNQMARKQKVGRHHNFAKPEPRQHL